MLFGASGTQRPCFISLLDLEVVVFDKVELLTPRTVLDFGDEISNWDEVLYFHL